MTPPSSLHATARYLWLAVLLGACLIAALHTWRYSGWVVDDIYITLRYARHLADGQGLVFNSGERVEGYSNFLHVLLSAACFRAGIDPIAPLKLLSAVAFVWMLWLCSRLEQRLVGPGLPLTPLLLLPLGACVYWAASPMETMLFAALALTAIHLLCVEAEKDAWRGSGIVFFLLALTRPEGVLVYAVATLVFAALECRVQRALRPLRRHVLNAVLFAVPFLGYTLWRVSYFGDVLPNTFYARSVGGSVQLVAGLTSLREWVLALPLFAVTLLYPFLLLLPAARRVCRLPWMLNGIYAVAFAQVAYVVAIGGDFMPFHRFFVLALPLFALLAAALLRAATASTAQPAAIVAIAVIAHAAWSLNTEQPYRALVADRTAVVGERVGDWLAQRLDPADVIAVNTAGAMPYFSRLPAIDMLGLTQPQIAHRAVYVVSPGWTAHRRGWGEHVLRRQPRVIFWYNSAGSREPHYLSDRELADDPIFRFFYRPERTRLPARAPDAIAARFIGDTVGETKTILHPGLGLRSNYQLQPLPQTTFRESEIVADFFTFDERDRALWAIAWTHRKDVPAFVDAASAHWSASAPAVETPPTPEVLALCDKARVLIEAKRYDEAKPVLAEAARRNQGRSALVYQYIATLAAFTGDLFTAVAAQKEALRLVPNTRLLRQNLSNFLVRPYEEARRAAH